MVTNNTIQRNSLRRHNKQRNYTEACLYKIVEAAALAAFPVHALARLLEEGLLLRQQLAKLAGRALHEHGHVLLQALGLTAQRMVHGACGRETPPQPSHRCRKLACTPSSQARDNLSGYYTFELSLVDNRHRQTPEKRSISQLMIHVYAAAAYTCTLCPLSNCRVTSLQEYHILYDY